MGLLTRSFRIIFLVPFFLFSNSRSAGQQSDFLIWKSVSLQKRVSKKLSINLEEGVRLRNNFGEFERNYTELAFRYRFSSRLDIRPGYRYTVQEDRNVHRIFWDLIYDYPVKKYRIILSGRLRYINDRAWFDIDHSIRPRIMIEYNIKGIKLNPFAGSENFFNMKRNFEWDRFRFTCGASFPIRKGTDFRIAYLYQADPSRRIPRREHILNLSVTASLGKFSLGSKKPDPDTGSD